MFTRRLIVAAAVTVLLLGLGSPARAQEVRSKMASFAKQIAEILKEDGQSEIAIGEITGPPAPASAAGPGMQKVLLEELEKLNCKHNDRAAIVVKGEYLAIDEDGKKDELIVEVVLTIRKKGKKLQELNTRLNHKANEDLVKILGVTTDLQSQYKAPEADRNTKIKESIEKPKVTINQSKCQPSPTSSFAVEILVKPNGSDEFKPAALQNKASEGNAFVDLKKGDEYIIRLHNNSKLESAVNVTIDGVDMFQFFEPANQRPTSVLVGAGKTREVKGWYRDLTKLNAFLVGSYSESAAAKVLRNTTKLGTITVCFHPCWEQGQTPPDYQNTRSSDSNATGLGREIKEKSQKVKRTIGPLLGAVTIRYNK